MGSATTNAMFALLGGTTLALVLFLPWAALRYRRRGSVGLGDALIGLGAAVYGVGVLAYTLLPLPPSNAVACAGGPAGVQLHPLASLDRVRRAAERFGLESLLYNSLAAQLVLNVTLFVPLGMFVAHLSGRGLLRGVLRATLVGLALSALIEVTQVTGVWGLYSCAYRILDVDDLLSNTLGALIGGLASPVLRLVPGQRAVDPHRVRRVTLMRRLLGMGSDALASVLVAGVLVASAAVLDVLLGQADGLSPSTALVLGLVPAVGHLLWVVTTGRTLGEAVVRLRPVPAPGVLRRILRWAAGIGGWTALGAMGLPLWQGLFTLAALVGLLVIPARRGLAAAVSGLRILDERDPRLVASPPPSPAPDASDATDASDIGFPPS